jgi:hypothetical protein
MGEKRKPAEGSAGDKKHKKQRKEEQANDTAKKPRVKEDSVDLISFL